MAGKRVVGCCAGVGSPKSDSVSVSYFVGGSSGGFFCCVFLILIGS